MTNYILIDAETRAPVPLPYETIDTDGEPVRVTDARMGLRGAEIYIVDPTGKWDSLDGWEEIGSVRDLDLITEEAFMKEREND